MKFLINFKFSSIHVATCVAKNATFLWCFYIVSGANDTKRCHIFNREIFGDIMWLNILNSTRFKINWTLVFWFNWPKLRTETIFLTIIYYVAFLLHHLVLFINMFIIYKIIMRFFLPKYWNNQIDKNLHDVPTNWGKQVHLRQFLCKRLYFVFLFLFCV